MNTARSFWLAMGLLLATALAHSQNGPTANDTVPPYSGHFRLGVNLGAYYFWTDDQLANIAAGNPNLGVTGIGASALRVTLPEWFLDYWGYDIRTDVFGHYEKLGLTENVVFVGYPAPQHKDTARHCPEQPSRLFANLYAPIWDDGENGTPVNDTNYFALYLYNMVSRYRHQVKFWEIWNEPDFDFVGGSSLPPGDPGNWWEYDPDPCHYALHAPVQHYVRMLRIGYEVIKSLSPESYVAIGGIGYPSFLDAVLRNTDNPNGGTTDSLYPHKGGAWFDVLSFHSYPHIDNSLREWSNHIMGFKYFRHSDRCVEGLLKRRDDLLAVLEKHGYNGVTFPKKHWIITESNIPRIPFGEYIGSGEAQCNYLIKAAVACKMNDIHQFHIYQLGDIRNRADARSEFDLMGLYARLDSVPQYRQKIHPAGIACRTVSTLLEGKTHDPHRTALLQLPHDVRGGAFVGEDGRYTYVLWAATSTDRSEHAMTNYSFPVALGLGTMLRREWDFSSVAITTTVPANRVPLTGAPIFLKDAEDEQPAANAPDLQLFCLPNPFGEKMQVKLQLPENMSSTLSLHDMSGRLVRAFFTDSPLAAGGHEFYLDGANLPAGIYMLRFTSLTGRVAVCRVVKI